MGCQEKLTFSSFSEMSHKDKRKLPTYLCCGASQVELMVKNLPASAGDIRDTGSIPGSGRSPGGGQGNPLQYSYLENTMDREDWQATVHRVAKGRTPLKQFSRHTRMRVCICACIC